MWLCNGSRYYSLFRSNFLSQYHGVNKTILYIFLLEMAVCSIDINNMTLHVEQLLQSQVTGDISIGFKMVPHLLMH